MPGQTVPTPASLLLAEMAGAAAVIAEQWPAASADRQAGERVSEAAYALVSVLGAALVDDHTRTARYAAHVAGIAEDAAAIADGGAR